MDVWFAWKIPDISMNYLLEQINKSRYKKEIKIQQYIKLNTGAKEIQTLNPGGTDNSQIINR